MEKGKPDPAKLLKGKYLTQTWNHWEGENNRLYCGIGNRPPGRWNVNIPSGSLLHLIAGEVILTEEGKKKGHRFRRVTASSFRGLQGHLGDREEGAEALLDPAAGQDDVTETILITGAAKRIGRQLALDLAAAGMTSSSLQHLARGRRGCAGGIRTLGRKAFIVVGDLSKPEVPERLMADAVGGAGPITRAHHNASVFEPDDVGEITLESWTEHLDTNLRAPIMLSQAFGRQLPGTGTATSSTSSTSGCGSSTRASFLLPCRRRACDCNQNACPGAGAAHPRQCHRPPARRCPASAWTRPSSTSRRG